MILPIGYDNFRQVIEKGLTFVDKSLLIKEFLQDKGAQTALILRPRRFGKTLNLSMLQHFFADKVLGKTTKGLFDQLKIAQDAECMQHHGKYPVIFISFKDIKDDNFKSAYENLGNLFSRIYSEYEEVLESSKLTANQKRIFQSILAEEATEASIKNALLDLTKCLYLHYDCAPILIIDEYDTPIHSGYIHNYYEEIIRLMRSILGCVLKTNPYLQRGILSGILRISSESLFSDLNNLEVYSLFRSEYSQYFGFTEEELNQLIQQADLEEEKDAIKNWYSGYQIGNTTVYNPWSIVNCIKQRELKPYWVNTSDNTLIKNLLIQSSNQFKSQFELLLQGNSIERYIDENFVFPNLKKQDASVWGLLLMAGYLTVSSHQETNQGTLSQLTIPNQEVRNLYQKIIEQWLSNGYGVEWYNLFLESLLKGEIENFKKYLEEVMTKTTSVHDFSHEPEAFYHGFMIGLTASLNRNEYEIKSNRESGYGRYDIIIIPKNTEQLAIILELKQVNHISKEEVLAHLLEQTAKEALLQISKNQYCAELQHRGIYNFVKIGLAFNNKKFAIQYEKCKK